MTTTRNTPPANIWETLRRLLNCNKTQLAERLDVTPRTLHRWEAGAAGDDAERRAGQLLREILQSAGCDRHAQWPLERAQIMAALDSMSEDANRYFER
jgi:transcriptional regulator with XRE-family HTH domain